MLTAGNGEGGIKMPQCRVNCFASSTGMSSSRAWIGIDGIRIYASSRDEKVSASRLWRLHGLFRPDLILRQVLAFLFSKLACEI